MKSLFVTLTLKRKLCLLLSVVLILTLFPVYAFADDPEELDSSGDSDIITNEMVDSELQSIANNLYQVQLLNDTRATTYTATDIYNFMVNHFLMGGAQNGYMYQQYSTLLAMNTKLQAIMSYANSIREYTELIHDNITGDNTPITLYDLIGDHLGNISDLLGVTQGDTTLSAAELLLLINNTLDDSYLALGNIQTTLDSIQDNIALLYAVMTDIAESNNDIVTQTTNMNANMQLMIARLQSIQNDFNDISWSFTNSSYLGFKHDMTDTEYSTDYFNVSTYPTGYFVFNNYIQNNSSIIYRFCIPLRGINNNSNNVIKSITILDSNGYIMHGDIYITYDSMRSSVYIYLFNAISFLRSSENIYIKVDFITNYYISSPTSTSGIYILTDSNLDYYTVFNYLLSKVNSDVLQKFKDLYASDDLIAAKDDQQGYEDQAIEDFTGSGSAAAKGSDLTDMKSISGALKQGLSSGGSVSNALSPFNTNSGFWAWFSQSNYDDINNLSTPRLRAGNPSNELEIIDFYNDNQLTLHGLLSGGGN